MDDTVSKAQVNFPLQVLSKYSGIRYMVEDAEILAWCFEEYDSDDPDYIEWDIVIDSACRRVRVQIEIMHQLRRLELMHDEVKPEDKRMLETFTLKPCRVTKSGIAKFLKRQVGEA